MYTKRNEEFDIVSILRLVRRNWFRLTALTLLTTFLANVYVLFSSPQFTINGSLFIGDAGVAGSPASGNDSLQFMQSFETLSDIETDVELLQSQSLVEQAILETGFNAPVRPAGAKDLTFLTWRLFRGETVQAYAPQPGDLQALYASVDQPGTGPWRLSVVIGQSGTYKILDTGGREVLAGTLGQPASGGGLNLLLKPFWAGSPPAPGNRYILRVSSAQSIYQSLMRRGELSISPGGTLSAPTKLVNLQLVATNPYAGQRMMNQLMNDFIASQLAWKTGSASVTEDFIAGQLKVIRQNLGLADQNLASYQSQTGILDVPENAKAIIGQLAQYQTQRTALQLQQEALQQLNQDMQGGSGTLSPFLVGESSDPLLGQLASSLAAAQAQEEAENAQFTDNATELQVQQATVARIEESIRTLVANDLRLTSSSLTRMDEAIAQYNVKLTSMPAESLKVIGLQRASDVYGQLYVLLMQKAEEAAVSKAATLVNSRVVVPAVLPLEAAQPRAATTILAGFLFGLVGGTLALLWRHGISGKFETDDEIRRDVPLPIHGMIPTRGRRDGKRDVLCLHDDGPFAEAFRFLRGNLPEPAKEGDGSVILVTSAQAGDGKTLVAANLAKSLADAGRKVLLIDADLRIAGAAKPLRAPADGGGLSDWLQVAREPALQQLEGMNFMYLPAGTVPQRPAELLETRKFGEIIKVLRQHFDAIVLDSPPLPAVSDGMILARHADLVLSVLRLGQSDRRVVWHHVQALARVKKPQAVVVNGMIGQIFGYGYGPLSRNERMLFPRRHVG
jgi:capsular exopolysaccharide synthesis family protein